jgi:VWFA-related protein
MVRQAYDLYASYGILGNGNLMVRRISIVGFYGVACLVAQSPTAFQTPDLPSATFHAGTRLVEIEVVVRGKHGPVAGLTKDNFTVLDQGKPQRIDVFRAGQASSAAAAVPLASGAVSNRVNRLGEALPNATVVLFDQLNTRLDLKAYESKGMLKLIRGLGLRDRAAIYTLGRNLHVLQDFTDDPAKLLAAVTHLDSGRDLMPANVQDALFDFPTDATGEVQGPSKRVASAGVRREYKDSIENLAKTNAAVNAAINDQITVEALRRVVEHLSGMPGRRNLVWVKEDPTVPLAVMGMLLQANISLYPVLVRSSYGDGRIFMVPFGGNDGSISVAPDFGSSECSGSAMAAVTGGAGFCDAQDLQLALKTAEEDSQSAYTLGYYPSEDALDGQYHSLSVKVAGGKSAHLELRYRPGYLATKQQALPPALPPEVALAELFQNPLDDTGLGITARVEPDPRPGLYRVRVTLDIHDVHLERHDNRSVGKVELAFSFGESARVRTMDIDLTDDQLAEGLKTGYEMLATGIQPSGDFIRVVVRDPSTGIAGSLKTPIRQ